MGFDSLYSLAIGFYNTLQKIASWLLYKPLANIEFAEDSPPLVQALSQINGMSIAGAIFGGLLGTVILWKLLKFLKVW